MSARPTLIVQISDLHIKPPGVLAYRKVDTAMALARCVEADVWTTDRDFAGTGVASWSTPNLMRGLARAARARMKVGLSAFSNLP